jgi:hypothetical protein
VEEALPSNVGDSEDWKPPVLCFAKGFVGERPSGEAAPVGFPRSFGSAMPVGCAGGSIEALNGFVDVGCACSGSAIIGCCEKLGIPFCGAKEFCGLNG